jgi:hypothetical protein
MTHASQSLAGAYDGRPEGGTVVDLAAYRAARRPEPEPGEPGLSELAVAGGGGFTLERFMERARLVLLDGGGAGAPAGRVVPLRVV